ncbi:hypothetical protein [Streptomyces sp. NPDC090021]|uniref:hypothetical protein n=1 Tax=Streptomyces sp. NPDC090021 TaxID=3365919 RepID=UPI00382CCD18
MSVPISVVIAYHSGYGHTARQAAAVAEGAATVPGVLADLRDVSTLDEDLNRLGSFVGAMAQSPSDLGPEESPAEADLRTARHLGEHVARTALQFVHGRQATDALAVTA